MITIRIALNTDIEEIQSLYRNTVLETGDKQA